MKTKSLLDRAAPHGLAGDLRDNGEADAKYRGLLEAAPDAMVVVNQGGDIVLQNLQAEKQLGCRRDELLGQKVKNIIPEGLLPQQTQSK